MVRLRWVIYWDVHLKLAEYPSYPGVRYYTEKRDAYLLIGETMSAGYCVYWVSSQVQTFKASDCRLLGKA
jgi:hypothetical protein